MSPVLIIWGEQTSQKVVKTLQKSGREKEDSQRIELRSGGSEKKIERVWTLY